MIQSIIGDVLCYQNLFYEELYKKVYKHIVIRYQLHRVP